MNLKSISDSELLSKTKTLAFEERRIGIEVLHHLREIDARKLFASLGFSSLFAYCMTELGYSEGGTHRRISAMRLLREVPEYEAKLEEGKVSVATLSQVQSFLTQEKRQNGKSYSSEEKLEILAKVEGKSTQQTERVLATISPQLRREEKVRAINETETEIRFVVKKELMEKIDHLKNLLGGKRKIQDFAGLLEELVDMGIQKLDPQRKKTDRQSRPSNDREVVNVSESSLPLVEVALSEVSSRDVSCSELASAGEMRIGEKKATRYIPVTVKREVWKRDGGRCTFVDAKSGRRCGSQHALQWEHVVPYARGGQSTFENIKLLCQAHNQYAAIQAFGLSQMQRFWKT
jgi:hypothetical protein